MKTKSGSVYLELGDDDLKDSAKIADAILAFILKEYGISGAREQVKEAARAIAMGKKQEGVVNLKDLLPGDGVDHERSAPEGQLAKSFSDARKKAIKFTTKPPAEQSIATKSSGKQANAGSDSSSSSKRSSLASAAKTSTTTPEVRDDSAAATAASVTSVVVGDAKLAQAAANFRDSHRLTKGATYRLKFGGEERAITTLKMYAFDGSSKKMGFTNFVLTLMPSGEYSMYLYDANPSQGETPDMIVYGSGEEVVDQGMIYIQGVSNPNVVYYSQARETKGQEHGYTFVEPVSAAYVTHFFISQGIILNSLTAVKDAQKLLECGPTSQFSKDSYADLAEPAARVAKLKMLESQITANINERDGLLERKIILIGSTDQVAKEEREVIQDQIDTITEETKALIEEAASLAGRATFEDVSTTLKVAVASFSKDLSASRQVAAGLDRGAPANEDGQARSERGSVAAAAPAGHGGSLPGVFGGADLGAAAASASTANDGSDVPPPGRLTS